MIIIVDQEGEKIVKVLLDIALKVGGMQNLPQINKILTCIRLLPVSEKKEEQTQTPKNEEKETNAGNGDKL